MSHSAHKMATFGLSINKVSNARGYVARKEKVHCERCKQGVYQSPACLPAAKLYHHAALLASAIHC